MGDSTIRTALRRLEGKGFVTHSVNARTYIYLPVLQRTGRRDVGGASGVQDVRPDAASESGEEEMTHAVISAASRVWPRSPDALHARRASKICLIGLLQGERLHGLAAVRRHPGAHPILNDTDIRLAGQRLIAVYGTEAWFVAADLAVAAARAGNCSAADLCNRIAQAIEEMGSTHRGIFSRIQ